MNGEQQSVRSRRTNNHSKKDSNIDRVIPDVPDHVVKAMRDGPGQQAVGIIFKWKNIKNKEHRDIQLDELNANNSSKNSTRSKKKDHSKSGKRIGSDKGTRNKVKTSKRIRLYLGSNGDANRKSCRASTKTRKTVAGVPQSTAKVSIKDPKKKDDPVWTTSKSNNDSD